MVKSFHDQLCSVLDSPTQALQNFYYAEHSLQFIEDAKSRKRITDPLIREYRKRHKKYPADSLIYSWETSALAMGRILAEADLKDVFVVMEYNFPSKVDPNAKPRRADFLLFGKDRFGQKVIVVVEAKQWELALMEKSKQEDNIRVKKNRKFREELHPSVQSESYTIDLVDLLEERDAVGEFIIYSFSYLYNMHNLSPEKYAVLFDPKFNEVRESTPLYTAKYDRAFENRLRAILANGQGSDVWNAFNTIVEHS